jgi:hypothetical protein
MYAATAAVDGSRRNVVISKEWQRTWMKVQDLQDIKAGLLSEGEQRLHEEALLDICIAAKERRAVMPPKVSMAHSKLSTCEPRVTCTVFSHLLWPHHQA